MKELQCKNCQHFRQHYGLDGQRLYTIHCGHCTAVRRRKRNPDAKACDCFAEQEGREDDYVTKSYLTKTLLDYILKMDLLPEILELSRK